MTYQLKIFDNSHYMEGAETYMYGNYSTWKEAHLAARKIVEEYIEGKYEPGKTANDLSAAFSFYGEEPVIFYEDGTAPVRNFRARDYAEIFAKAFVQKRATDLSP